MSEAWFGRTVKLPIAPGSVTESADPSKRIFSAEIILSVICDSFNGLLCNLQATLLHFGKHLLAFLDCLVDGSDIEECLFGILVHLAGKNHLETTDGLAQGHHHAGKAGELLGNVEGLRQETLGATCAGNHELIFVGEFVDTKDGDDILKLIVFLQERYCNAPRR